MKRLLSLWLALLAAFWLARAATSALLFGRVDRGWAALVELAAIPILQAAALTWLTRRRAARQARRDASDAGGRAARRALRTALAPAVLAGANRANLPASADPADSADPAGPAPAEPAEPPDSAAEPLDSGPPPPYKRARRRRGEPGAGKSS